MSNPDELKSPLIDPRVAMAAERTLLAWMRTGLAMMGFGFVVARFGLFVRMMANPTEPHSPNSFSTWMGVLLVVTGVIVNGFAAIQHALILHDKTIVDRRRRISGWAGVTLTLFISAIGIVMAIYLIMNR